MDANLRRRLLVGETLGKSLGEVDSLSVAEIDTWVAWIQFQNDQLRKAQKRGRLKGGMKGRRK